MGNIALVRVTFVITFNRKRNFSGIQILSEFFFNFYSSKINKRNGKLNIESFMWRVCVSTNRKLFRTRASVVLCLFLYSLFFVSLATPNFSWAPVKWHSNWMDNSIANHTPSRKLKEKIYIYIYSVCYSNHHRQQWNYRFRAPCAVLYGYDELEIFPPNNKASYMGNLKCFRQTFGRWYTLDNCVQKRKKKIANQFSLLQIWNNWNLLNKFVIRIVLFAAANTAEKFTKKKEWRTFRLIMIDSCGMYLRLIRVSLLFSSEFFFHSAFHAWLELEFHMNHVRVKDANFVYIVYNWRDWLPACLPACRRKPEYFSRSWRSSQLNCLSWMAFFRVGREKHERDMTWLTFSAAR